MREGAHIAATLMMGFMVGVFGLYSVAIMPGLLRTDDRTFVGAFQSIDRAIINPLFLAIFLGTLLLTGVSACFILVMSGAPSSCGLLLRSRSI